MHEIEYREWQKNQTSYCMVDSVVGELSEIIRSLEDVVRHCKEMDYIAVALMLRSDTDRIRQVKENLIPNAEAHGRAVASNVQQIVGDSGSGGGNAS
jgi:signal transduction histidine kinase